MLGNEHAYQGVFRGLVARPQAEGLVRADIDPRVAGAVRARVDELGLPLVLARAARSSPEQIAAELAGMAIRGIATPRRSCGGPRRR